MAESLQPLQTYFKRCVPWVRSRAPWVQRQTTLVDWQSGTELVTEVPQNTEIKKGWGSTYTTYNEYKSPGSHYNNHSRNLLSSKYIPLLGSWD